MAQAIQDNPEIGAVLQGYQQGDYDGLLNSQAALQALADSTGVSVDVIITNITKELRAKGATDGQLVAIDQDPSNRKDAVKTTAHELDHVRGGSSETLANLEGIAADLNVSASMDANQDKIDSYKPVLGDGVDETTRDALLLGLSAAAGAIVGGNTASTATSFSQTQNNHLSHKQIVEWGKELESCVKGKGSQCTVAAKEAINDKYIRKSEQQQQELRSACGSNGSAQQCDVLRNNYYNVEGIPYDKQVEKYAPKIISYGYGSKASSKLAVVQTMHNMEAEGIFASQTVNQEREKGKSGKAFAMEMAPVIAAGVIAGKMGSNRGTINASTNDKGTSPNNIGRNNSNYDKARQEKISHNNQTPHKSPRPLDNPNAVQTSIKRLPETGQKPNVILYRKNNNNTVTSYATYDSRGMIIKRVDVTRADHKDKSGKPIPTPHVLDYGRIFIEKARLIFNKPSYC